MVYYLNVENYKFFVLSSLKNVSNVHSQTLLFSQFENVKHNWVKYETKNQDLSYPKFFVKPKIVQYNDLRTSQFEN